MKWLALLLPAIIAFTPVQAADDERDKELEASGARLNRLGISLLGSLPEKTGNVVVCGWNAQRSLALLGTGGAGETRAEISNALGNAEFPEDVKRLRRSFGSDVSKWNDRWARQGGVDGIVPKITWADPCAVWLDSTLKLRPAFSNAVQNVLGASAGTVDFRNNSGKAVVDINQWISTATRGRIPRLLDGNSVTSRTRCALTAATLIKAPWNQTFDAGKTVREPFMTDAGMTASVATMVKRGNFASAVFDDCTAVSVTAAFEFQLLVLVPKAPGGLNSLLSKVTPELLQICATMKESRIELHLPRFRVPAVPRDLQHAFTAIGIRTAFDRMKADFSAMSALPAFVEGAFEASEFQVDELGLSGAGAIVVTSGLLGNPDALPADSIFRVERPFFFALQHRKSGGCLFLGRVAKPE